MPVSQKGAYKLSTQSTRTFQQLFSARSQVRYASEIQVCTFPTVHEAITVKYDSGADESYISKNNRKRQDPQYCAAPQEEWAW